MAIYFRIMVNERQIGYWAAQRGKQVEPGVYVYKVEGEINGEPFTGKIRHEYNDGALALIRRSLESLDNGSH